MATPQVCRRHDIASPSIHHTGRRPKIKAAGFFNTTSIVISKPIDFIVKDGQMLHSKEKQFAFLGVYSGEPVRHEKPIEFDDMVIIQKLGYNVGVVWYADLVEEIIKDGVTFPR